MEKEKVGALILAAGKGTRMRSRLPKVLQPILGEPMLAYVIEAVKKAGIRHVAVVVGHGGEDVVSYMEEEHPSVDVVWQKEQLGTGHAVKVAASWWETLDSLLVLYGDTPLISPRLLSSFVESSAASQRASALVSFTASDPSGYGRVFRDGEGAFVVEDKDATPDQRCCTEVNSGICLFHRSSLEKALRHLTTSNAQGEYYLPDVVRWCSRENLGAHVFHWDWPEDLMGINDPYQLALAGEVMRDRILRHWMKEKGLKCENMRSVWVGPKVVFEDDVFLGENVRIFGESFLGEESRVGAGSVVSESSIGPGAVLNPYVILERSVVRKGASMGPFAYVRGDSLVEDHAFVGKFVELKNTRVGSRSKVPHLSYMGDAVIGSGTNIGAGTITCNYDGKKKHPTSIGDHCFIGSDTMLVAPVTLEDDAVTAAGSVITEDIPQGALGVARTRQKNILGWQKRRGMFQKTKKEE